MEYLIGLDIGTSGTKGVLFDTNGQPKFSHTEEYPMYQPQNGYAEENPDDLWEASKLVLKALAEEAKGGKILGIGLSGQMHSLCLLDKDNKVIRPAILWCDTRTANECEEIEELVGSDRLREITASSALPGFTASKIMWVKKHEPDNYARVAHILLVKDYIRFKLTGEYATDVSDASGMQLFDVRGRCFSEEICDKIGVDTALLPRVYESCEVSGYISREASLLTGLDDGIPVAAGAGDNAAAAIGTGVCSDGQAFTTIGTSGVVFAHTKELVKDAGGRVHTFCAAVPGEWHVMGVTQAAGLSLNWLRSNIMKEKSYSDIDRECAEIPIGADRLIFLPYLMGERTPVLDGNARGVFFGLSALHTDAHLARAVVEGVSFSLMNCLDVLVEMGVSVNDMAFCGGGAKSPFWRQMLADVYNRPITIKSSTEGAALGAALLAGCAAGVYRSVAEACGIAVRDKETTSPSASRHEEYMRYYKVYNGLYPSLKESFSTLKED